MTEVRAKRKLSYPEIWDGHAAERIAKVIDREG